MRLPDPFVNPDLAVGFVTARLIDNNPLIRDELPNGKVLEAKISAQYFGIEIVYPDLFPQEFMFLDAFISEYKRTGGFVEILLPQYENVRVTGSTSATTIAANQKGSTIVIQNIGGLTGQPQPGDLFKLTTHPKVYKITKVVKSSTTLTLSLYPDLFITTNGADKPVFNGVLFQTKLAAGESLANDITVDGVYTGVSLKFRESL